MLGRGKQHSILFLKSPTVDFVHDHDCNKNKPLQNYKWANSIPRNPTHLQLFSTIHLHESLSVQLKNQLVYHNCCIYLNIHTTSF